MPFSAHLLTYRLLGQSGTVTTTTTGRMSLGSILTHSPVRGKPMCPKSPTSHRNVYDLFVAWNHPPDHFSGLMCQLPELNFPTFDCIPTLGCGSLARTENYFDMYMVEASSWVLISWLYGWDLIYAVRPSPLTVT